MDRPRLIRWLRIAVTAVCVVVCVGLIGLWVRSYRWMDVVQEPTSTLRSRGVISVQGCIYWLDAPYHKGPDFLSFPVNEGTRQNPVTWPKKIWHRWFGFGFARAVETAGEKWGISIPHWFLLTLFAACASASWLPWYKLRWRFSLRTMLIVTTLVAMTLGFVVWMAR